MIEVDEWFETRARLSHDVLKNKVMVAFGSTSQGVPSLAPLIPYLHLFVEREREFREFVKDAPTVLRPGSWLVDWIGKHLDIETALALSAFLNLDFERTSSLLVNCRDVEALLDKAVTATRRVLMSQSINADDDTVEVEKLIQELSNALTALPSTMLEVVESMK